MIDRLRELTRRNGWTQEVVAARLGVTQGYVSRLFTARHAPSSKLAARINALVQHHMPEDGPMSLGDRVMRAAEASPRFRALVEAALDLANEDE